jgi:hypothetical protein
VAERLLSPKRKAGDAGKKILKKIGSTFAKSREHSYLCNPFEKGRGEQAKSGPFLQGINPTMSPPGRGRLQVPESFYQPEGNHVL